MKIESKELAGFIKSMLELKELESCSTVELYQRLNTNHFRENLAIALQSELIATDNKLKTEAVFICDLQSFIVKHTYSWGNYDGGNSFYSVNPETFANAIIQRFFCEVLKNKNIKDLDIEITIKKRDRKIRNWEYFEDD